MVDNFLFKDRDGQTPLPRELRKGLKPKNIQTIGELDEYEEENITEGLVWLAQYQGEYLTYNFWLQSHKKLFGNVWSWAGQVRDHELNNADFLLPDKIWPAFKQLEDDLKFWIKNNTYSKKEIAVHFHERLVAIHPFVNGNGRFARIMTENFCNQEGVQIPTWGISEINFPKKRRSDYINAIVEARHHRNFESLLDFMYS